LRMDAVTRFSTVETLSVYLVGEPFTVFPSILILNLSARRGTRLSLRAIT
jgi:hypothetical protein